MEAKSDGRPLIVTDALGLSRRYPSGGVFLSSAEFGKVWSVRRVVAGRTFCHAFPMEQQGARYKLACICVSRGDKGDSLWTRV